MAQSCCNHGWAMNSHVSMPATDRCSTTAVSHRGAGGMVLGLATLRLGVV